MLRNEYKQAKTKYVLKLTIYLKCTISQYVDLF